MPLNDIATEQTKATEKTQAATNQMLDYLATHPDATIRYHASDMILHIHSDGENRFHWGVLPSAPSIERE
jgi:hypothetical protein